MGESVAFSWAIQHLSSGTRNFEPWNVTDLFAVPRSDKWLWKFFKYEWLLTFLLTLLWMLIHCHRIIVILAVLWVIWNVNPSKLQVGVEVWSDSCICHLQVVSVSEAAILCRPFILNLDKISSFILTRFHIITLYPASFNCFKYEILDIKMKAK